MIGTFFNGGLRAYDISNPYQPKEVGDLRAAAAEGTPAGAVQLNDVFVDEREHRVHRRPPHRRAVHAGDGFLNELFPSPAAGRFGRRLKRERGPRVPVTVITGFLGAGKTTLLKRFLATPEGQGTAVVVNEFGATGIDDALVRSSADETVLLGNGCLCCITRTDLQQALRRMVVERERGELPDFRRIVIETSGLADPSPILQTFATDRALGSVFHIEAVVTVVDAETGLDTLGWSAEARKQAILADRLVITKTDIAGEGASAALTAQLRALNPGAEILEAVNGELDPTRLTEAAPDQRNAFVAEAAHSDGIGSFVLTQEKPMPLGCIRTFDGRADAIARAGPAACQRLPQRGGLQGAGRGSIRAAPRPSAGRTGTLAG